MDSVHSDFFSVTLLRFEVIFLTYFSILFLLQLTFNIILVSDETFILSGYFTLLGRSAIKLYICMYICVGRYK